MRVLGFPLPNTWRNLAEQLKGGKLVARGFRGFSLHGREGLVELFIPCWTGSSKKEQEGARTKWWPSNMFPSAGFSFHDLPVVNLEFMDGLNHWLIGQSLHNLIISDHPLTDTSRDNVLLTTEVFLSLSSRQYKQTILEPLYFWPCVFMVPLIK